MLHRFLLPLFLDFDLSSWFSSHLFLSRRVISIPRPFLANNIQRLREDWLWIIHDKERTDEKAVLYTGRPDIIYNQRKPVARAVFQRDLR